MEMLQLQKISQISKILAPPLLILLKTICSYSAMCGLFEANFFAFWDFVRVCAYFGLQGSAGFTMFYL